MFENFVKFWQIVSLKIMIFSDFRVAFAAPTGGPGGVARCHLHGLGVRYDKKYKKNKKMVKTFFSMKKFCWRKNFFRKNRKNLEKVNFFSTKKVIGKKVFSNFSHTFITAWESFWDRMLSAFYKCILIKGCVRRERVVFLSLEIIVFSPSLEKTWWCMIRNYCWFGMFWSLSRKISLG